MTLRHSLRGERAGVRGNGMMEYSMEYHQVEECHSERSPAPHGVLGEVKNLRDPSPCSG
jgi:hypothetical protein